jgi:Mn-dependent DtxR family transcriptional regulator
MSQKAKTSDELFLLRLHTMANALGDPHKPISIAKVAKAVGLRETAVKNIVKHLAQANLVEKVEGDRIALTARGISLVHNL